MLHVAVYFLFFVVSLVIYVAVWLACLPAFLPACLPARSPALFVPFGVSANAIRLCVPCRHKPSSVFSLQATNVAPRPVPVSLSIPLRGRYRGGSVVWLFFERAQQQPTKVFIRGGDVRVFFVPPQPQPPCLLAHQPDCLPAWLSTCLAAYLPDLPLPALPVVLPSFLQEMAKADFKLPLLIGGATTSKMHTAVKISPQYASPEVRLFP